MKNTHRAWSLVAMLLLLCPLAVFAQARSFNAQGPYQDVEIQVKDLDSDRVIATVRPGGTVTLREGQRVRLIMTARHPNQRGLVYPETEFTEADPGRGWVRVTRTNVDNANATLRIVRPRGATGSRTEALSYRIVESLGAGSVGGMPDNLRQGTINVRVEPASASGSSPAATRQQARDLTNKLYQAILMRNLDETGARSHVDSIANGGYPALVQVAERIAESDESRIRVYEREGVCNQQRLLSMYKNLLGLSAEQIDREQWETDLRRMNEGQIDAVVLGMVRSNRFQQIHNLERMAIRY